MAKWKLHMLALATMFAALALSVLVLVRDGSYWAYVPLVVWLVLVQIFIVPRILGKNFRWGLFLLVLACMALSGLLSALIAERGGGLFAIIPMLIWLVWALKYAMPKVDASMEREE